MNVPQPSSAFTPAKRGQYAVVPMKTYVVWSDIPPEERQRRGIRDTPGESGLVYTDVFKVCQVTSVARDGRVKVCKWREGTAGIPRTVKSPAGVHLIPAEYASPRLAAMGEQEFLTLDDVRRAVRGQA